MDTTETPEQQPTASKICPSAPPRRRRVLTKKMLEQIKHEVDDDYGCPPQAVQRDVDIIDMRATPQLESAATQDTDGVEYIETRPTTHVLSLLTSLNLLDDADMSDSDKTITIDEATTSTATVAASAQIAVSTNVGPGGLTPTSIPFTEEDAEALLNDTESHAAEVASRGESLLDDDEDL